MINWPGKELQRRRRARAATRDQVHSHQLQLRMILILKKTSRLPFSVHHHQSSSDPHGQSMDMASTATYGYLALHTRRLPLETHAHMSQPLFWSGSIFLPWLWTYMMIFGLVDAQYLPVHHFLRKATHKAAFFGFYLASYQFCVTLHGIMVCSIWSSWLIRGSSYIT